MITGFIQLRPERKFNLWRAEKKALVPLLSFGLLYAWLEVIFTTKGITAKGLGEAVISFLQGRGWTHMWYLYTLVGLYVFFPMLKAFVAYADKRGIEFVLVVLLVFNIILPTVKQYVNFNSGFTIPINSPYFFYCLLGYYLYRWPLSLRFSFALSVFSFCLIIVWTMIERKGFQYYTASVALFSASLFALFTALEEQCSHLNEKVMLFVSDKTFGIYIIHMVFINVIHRIIRFNPYECFFPISWIGVGAVTFAASLLGVILIRKIPFIKKVFSV